MSTTASLPAYMLSGVAVQQPPHLEGDASFATEILPGPPSLLSVQQSAQKRDPRKRFTDCSYLPTSDPGSTYSGVMHGTLIGHEPEGPRSKRSRADKGAASGRAQRASARNQIGISSTVDSSMNLESGSTSTLQPILVDWDSCTMVIDDDLSLSRSNSSLNLQDPPQASSSGRARRKDKGKGKEAETPPIRVKEEPKNISLHTPEPVLNLLNNEDHCSSCRSHGALVYCDGCPRAFHLWCLDPPMEGVDEGDSRWFCPNCTIQKHPPRKPPPSLLSPLIYQLETSIPVEFQLPDEFRSFFKDVATGPKGSYEDSSEIKPPRLNRHGQLEDREPHRLRDRNGAPVLCFHCGMSALPTGLAATAPASKRPRRSTSKAASPETWKSIVSCDYCHLHWHLDCLNPPLPTMPLTNKKWMCPNHVERVLPPKRRIPKQNAPPIEVTKPRQYNNGNIDVIHPEIYPPTQNPRVIADEVLINGRRYRVPERVIVLDFWNKLNKFGEQTNKDVDLVSGMSSPLTSLSSLDELDDQVSDTGPAVDGINDLKVAQLLCRLSSAKSGGAQSLPDVVTSKGVKKLVDRSVQTDSQVQVLPIPKPGRSKPAAKRSPTKHGGVNGMTRSPQSTSSEIMNVSAGPLASTAKRKRSTQQAQPEASTRELRSQSKNHDSNSLSARSSLRRIEEPNKDSQVPNALITPPILLPNPSKLRTVNVKLEEIDNAFALANVSESLASSSALPKMTPRRPCAPRRLTQKETDDHPIDVKEKRGRKRKVREDELPEVGKTNGVEADDRKASEKRKDKKVKPGKKTTIRTSSQQGPMQPPNTTPTASNSSRLIPSISLPATPSLKIRLPRLTGSITKNVSPAVPSSNGKPPARL